MKTISIYELQRNPGKALEEVPVTITNHGKKWRIVTGTNIEESTYNKPATKPIVINDKEGLEQIVKQWNSPKSNVCKVKGCGFLVMNGVCLSKQAHRQ